jgi:hypothetical protein
VSGQATGRWYYRARASNAGGDGPWSNTESVGVVPDAPALEPISNPEGDGEYTVQWNAVTGATGYELQEAEDADFSSYTVPYSGSGTQYQATGQPSGRWYYRVRASNAGATAPGPTPSR